MISGQPQAVRDRQGGEQQVAFGSAIFCCHGNSNSEAGNFGAFQHARRGRSALFGSEPNVRALLMLSCLRKCLLHTVPLQTCR